METTPETLARRLEASVERMTALLNPAQVQEKHLRAAPGSAEWNTLQVLGHMVEMLPYWTAQSRQLIDADQPPPFGRALESPERLAGIERGNSAGLVELLQQVQAETRAAAGFIRGLSPEARAKTGIHPRRGPMTVDEIARIFMVEHAEEHLEQVREVLRVTGGG